MTPKTKVQAQKKLDGIRNKIGYPDKWRDYSSVVVKPNDLVGNVERATVFESKRELNKIGKPVDKNEWGMTPPTVNAYYNPQMNDINFPAGVLQPPLYDPKMEDAPNYGNTGGTIGHEITHGFDDEGRQFDAQGNLQDWWTAEDEDRFPARAEVLRKKFVGYAIGCLSQQRDAALRSALLSDVHSPAKWRVLGPLSNIPEFYGAFNVM